MAILRAGGSRHRRLLSWVRKMNEKIKRYFKQNKLPKPVTIKEIGPWAHGTCYAVTCGLLRIRKFCVYFIGNQIHSVRERK